jgi:hypothetical protein
VPTLPSGSFTTMSTLTWGDAISDVAGAVSLKSSGDTRLAAQRAITATLQDWHTRHDWRFTQVIASDIPIAAGTSDFALPSTFKKPYVAYTSTTRPALEFIEVGNWYRAASLYGSGGGPWFYTLFNSDDTGLGQVFPPVGSDSLIQLLYYREGTYYPTDDTTALDIPKRWEVYILDGAKARLTLGKESKKSDTYFALYEKGIKQARVDDRRQPDYFATFSPSANSDTNAFYNPNAAVAQWDW